MPIRERLRDPAQIQRHQCSTWGFDHRVQHLQPLLHYHVRPLRGLHQAPADRHRQAVLVQHQAGASLREGSVLPP